MFAEYIVMGLIVELGKDGIPCNSDHGTKYSNL